MGHCGRALRRLCVRRREALLLHDNAEIRSRVASVTEQLAELSSSDAFPDDDGSATLTDDAVDFAPAFRWLYFSVRHCTAEDWEHLKSSISHVSTGREDYKRFVPGDAWFKHAAQCLHTVRNSDAEPDDAITAVTPAADL